MFIPFSVQHPKSLTTLECGSKIFITDNSFSKSFLSLSVALVFVVFIATLVVLSSSGSPSTSPLQTVPKHPSPIKNLFSELSLKNIWNMFSNVNFR